MNASKASKAAVAASVAIAEGVSLDTFHAKFVAYGQAESQAETLQAQAEKATTLAASAAWVAGRDVSALILSKAVSMRDVAKSEGVSLATVERLHRIGRLALTATTEPTPAEVVALWAFCKGTAGEGVSAAYDTVADKGLPADALLSTVEKAAAMVRKAKAARKTPQDPGTPEPGTPDAGTPGTPDAGTPESGTPSQDETSDADAAPEPEVTTMYDVMTNLAAWAETGIALREAGEPFSFADADKALAVVARLAAMVRKDRDAARDAGLAAVAGE